jgi:glycosyltransferase involved in cell wall biosynthesis
MTRNGGNNVNILHYIESTAFTYGGPPRFALDACRVMAAEGHDSTILTADTTDSPAAWLEEAGSRSEGTPTVAQLGALARPGGFIGLSGMRRVRASLRKADVVHLHGVWAPSNLQVAAAARAMGVPYVISVHGMLDDWSMAQRGAKKKAFLTLGGRYMLEHAARVHCTAQAEVDQSKKWFPNGAEAIIPYLMDLEPYRDLPGPALARQKFTALNSDGAPTVLFLSRLHYKKGPEFLLRAAQQLKQLGVNGKIAFAGTGDPAYIDSLKAMAAELGVEDRVHFLGMVVGREKLSLYQSADLFVLPTSQENFGLVLIEALACGTPVITTKGVDIWRDVEASGSGMICDQAPQILAETISTILSNDSLRKGMAAKARPWVFREFDEASLLRRFEGMYANAANATLGLVGGTAQPGWRNVAPAVAHHGH